MSKAEDPIQEELNRPTIRKAPRYVQELLGNPEHTIAIHNSFKSDEELVLEAQRNITSRGDMSAKEKVGAMKMVDHLLDHMRLFDKAGEHDLEQRQKSK